VVLESDIYGGDASSTSLSGAGTVNRKEGVLEMTARERGTPLIHGRSLDTPVDAVRLDADVDIGPSSRAGLMCQSEGIDRALSVGMLFGSSALIGRFDTDGWTEGARIDHGQPFRPDAHLAVECAITPDGGEHVALWLDGDLVLDHVLNTVGPFGATGLSAEVFEPGEVMLYTNVTTSAGDGYAPSEEGSALATVLTDGFDDETLWDPYDDGELSLGYLDGALQATITEAGRNIWSWQTVNASPSMRMETDGTLDSDGVAGVMCGDNDSAQFIVDVMISSGDVALAQLIDGMLAATTWFPDRFGPFDAAGVIGEASDGPSEARFDAFEVAIGS
jgi:hypothetical protein